jgi:hypothetical protein
MALSRKGSASLGFFFILRSSWPLLRLNLNTHAKLVSRCGGIRLGETEKRPSLGLSKDFGFL